MMTKEEKAIRDFCGHHADWWPSITQVQEMLALAQPDQEPVACTECERLRDALKRANGLAEHFERAWYLQGDEIERLKAQPEQEQDNTYIYASSLATAIWQKHYMKESPKFALLDTTEGVLTQIDNMTCGLVREKPAQPEQEPRTQRDKNEVWFKYGFEY